MIVLHAFRDSERDAGGGGVRRSKIGNFSVTQLLNSLLHALLTHDAKQAYNCKEAIYSQYYAICLSTN